MEVFLRHAEGSGALPAEGKLHFPAAPLFATYVQVYFWFCVSQIEYIWEQDKHLGQTDLFSYF